MNCRKKRERGEIRNEKNTLRKWQLQKCILHISKRNHVVILFAACRAFRFLSSYGQRQRATENEDDDDMKSCLVERTNDVDNDKRFREKEYSFNFN